MDLLQRQRGGSLEISEQGVKYRVRTLHHGDVKRRAEYQFLRGSTFIQRLGWQIPVDETGKEVDRYDDGLDFVSTHCVYGIEAHSSQEALLGGVRLLTLRDWNHSMCSNEFYRSGMIPEWALQRLRSLYRCTDLLEITRLCVQPKPVAHFSRTVARDLAYASAYARANAVGRTLALGIADALYYQVMKRARFAFKDIYTHQINQKGGYAIIIIDLVETIWSLRAHGDEDRVKRMLALCPDGIMQW